MMERADLAKLYHWHHRPQIPCRPSWFTQWPGGKRIAVTFNIMHEWESVPRSTAIRKRAIDPASAAIDFLALTAREYGATFGFHRLLKLLDKHDVKATILASGLMAQLFPDSLRQASERGHEIACHHWDQSRHPIEYTTLEEEREAIMKSIDAIEKASGKRPVGYMSPGPRPSPFTLQICAALGFLWNGDYGNSDVPYGIDVNGKKIISLGYVRPAYTDNDVLPLGLAGALQQLKDEFAAHYEESAAQPMKFRYAMHNFTGGRPGLAQVFERFLDYVKSHEGVWFCRCLDIADFWAAHDGAPTPAAKI